MSGGQTPDAGGRPVLITGGAGFIGSNLADRLAALGHHVIVYDAFVRPGVERNLRWLQGRHSNRISVVRSDVRDRAALEEAAAEAGAVFHFAAQVAVTTSLADPRDDFDVNVGGTVSLLEALRRREVPPPIVFASTNKVYGDLADLAFERAEEGYRPVDPALAARGIGEDRPLDFHTPYGCSKGAADQYVLDYARSFGVPSAVLRMSCIYGPRQMGTEDQGWVAHFLIRALRGEPISIYGDGYQVRDVLDVGDAVDAYLAAWRNIGRVSGTAFNLGGGPRNAVSLRQVLALAAQLIGRKLDVSFSGWRAGDQRYYVSDVDKARRELDLAQPLGWREGVEKLLGWLADEHGVPIAGDALEAGPHAA